MQRKISCRLILIGFGIALLSAALFFDTGTAASNVPQAQATPTVDRLAKPTLPALPSQADRGAQMYWLSCLPCHGDKGQGLTDEFRTTYPPEDRNCWKSGCHGKRPYANGFTLPAQIPAVIGPGTLQKFPTAAILHSYISVAMPFWKPGSLTEEESWGVTAFILRQNGFWDGRSELNASNASDIKIAGRTPSRAGGQDRNGLLLGGIGAGILLLLLLFIFILKKTRNTTTI